MPLFYLVFKKIFEFSEKFQCGKLIVVQDQETQETEFVW